LIDEPDLEHPLRNEIAAQYRGNHSGFMKEAKDQTEQYAEPRDY